MKKKAIKKVAIEQAALIVGNLTQLQACEHLSAATQDVVFLLIETYIDRPYLKNWTRSCEALDAWLYYRSCYYEALMSKVP